MLLNNAQDKKIIFEIKAEPTGKKWKINLQQNRSACSADDPIKTQVTLYSRGEHVQTTRLTKDWYLR